MDIAQKISSRIGIKLQETIVSEFTIEEGMLSNERLNHLNLTGARFNNVNFENCVCVEVNFDGSQFWSTSFENVMFENCTFVNCDWHDAVFSNVTFNRGEFGRNEFYDCAFNSCRLFKVNMGWTQHEASHFTKSDIVNSDFSHSILSSVIFLDTQFDNNKQEELKIFETSIHTSPVLQGEVSTESEVIKALSGIR